MAHRRPTQNRINISGLTDFRSPEMRSRELRTSLKRHLRGGSNLFALGPPTNVKRAAQRVALFAFCLDGLGSECARAK